MVTSLMPQGGVCRCHGCGFSMPCEREVRHRCRPGLGDRVASALAAVGITDASVSRLVGRPCGCQGRRAALNRWGRRLGIG